MENQDLFESILDQNLFEVDRYIDGGGDVNAICTRNNMTPLIFTLCNFMRMENEIFDYIILRLLDAGSNVNARQPSTGMTATMLAMMRKRSEKIILGFIKVTDVSLVCNGGNTVLIYAIKYNYGKTVISELLRKGVDVNQSSTFDTPLYYTVSFRNDTDLTEALLNAGARVNEYDTARPFNGRSCPMKCKINETCNNKRIMDVLIKKGVDLKTKDEYGKTVIHLVRCNYVIYLALKNGVSIETKNDKSMSPLVYALIFGKEKANDLLLLGANPNCVGEHGYRPLHYSHIICDDKSINLLIFHGADLLAEDNDGNTPVRRIFALSDYLKSKTYELGTKALIKHYLLYVNENGLDEAIELIEDNRREYYKSFICACKEELSKMRNSFLKDGLSFYKFCLLKKCYRDNPIPIKIHEHKFHYRNIPIHFPLFQHIILMRYDDNNKKNFKRNLLSNLNSVLIKPAVEGDKIAIALSPVAFDLMSRNYLNLKQLYELFLASFEIIFV